MPEKDGSDAEAWARVIDVSESATVGEVASAAEEFIDGGDGLAALEAAIDAGNLVIKDGGMFGWVALANDETDDDTEASAEGGKSTAAPDDENDDGNTDDGWDPDAFTKYARSVRRPMRWWSTQRSPEIVT